MKLMNRLSKAAKILRGFEDYDDDKYLEFISGGTTKAGLRINEVNSLNISAIYAAVNIIASTIASIPKGIFRRLKTGGTEKAVDHPLYDKLRNKPNSTNLTSWQWIFTSIAHKYLWGNWYTYIDTASYQNREFIPLLPDRTWRDPKNSDKYITRQDKKELVIPANQMLHIPHFSLNGTSSKGVIHFARESLGLTMALDQFAASYFGHGTHVGGIARLQKALDPEDKKRLKADFNEKYQGLGKLFNTLFLPPVITDYKQEEVDPEKSQALESRQFSVVEVARWMNLPPHVLRELSRATFSNIEHQGIELVVYSFLPLTTQIEQAMNIVFFDDEERKDHFIKFELKGLLRGDIAARTEFYKTMLDRGVYNADMVLALEDLNPQPDGLGKIYAMPLNMVNKKMIASSQPLTIDSKGLFPPHRTVRLIEHRSGALRRKITIAWKVKFDEYAKQIVTIEVKALRAAIKEMLGERNVVDLGAWLDTFYQDFGKEIDFLSAPLITSYATAILPVAQEEISSDSDITPQYQDFQREYKDYFITRHVDSSKGQIKSLIAEFQEEEDLINTLNQRLDEWEERRPGKITMWESIRQENAFSRSVFGLCGIAKIISVSYGESCPYCLELDGMVIGIDDFFLTKGEFQPEGADKPLIVTSNYRHPPYHEGCDCGITAGI
jgi:HK97 family phage portal protein